MTQDEITYYLLERSTLQMTAAQTNEHNEEQHIERGKERENMKRRKQGTKKSTKLYSSDEGPRAALRCSFFS